MTHYTHFLNINPVNRVKSTSEKTQMTTEKENTLKTEAELKKIDEFKRINAFIDKHESLLLKLAK